MKGTQKKGFYRWSQFAKFSAKEKIKRSLSSTQDDVDRSDWLSQWRKSKAWPSEN